MGGVSVGPHGVSMDWGLGGVCYQPAGPRGLAPSLAFPENPPAGCKDASLWLGVGSTPDSVCAGVSEAWGPGVFMAPG